LAAALVSTLGLGACLQDEPTGNERSDARLLLRADLSGTAVATLVVEVTAPDIAPSLSFNIGIVGGAAAGTITIPSGSNRTITIRALTRVAFRRTTGRSPSASSLARIRRSRSC